MVQSVFERGVHAEIARLARNVHDTTVAKRTIEDSLREVTEAAVRMLPGVDYAGITLVEGRERVHSTVAKGSIPGILDKLQERYGQGPCLESTWDHHTVRVEDYEAETRWPEFIAAARAETSVRSSLSIHLYNTKTEFGALTLYSDQSLTFTPQFEELALALGAHAAIGLSCVRRDAQFESALASRDMIGQAKGMIMERYNLDAVAAFALMVTLSQESNTPVTEISRQLVESEHPSP